MFMTFEDIVKEQRKDKRLIDSLGIKYLNYDDILVCNYVAKQLSTFNLGIVHINLGNKITFEDLINTSVNELFIFDDYLTLGLLNILNKIQISKVDDDFGFGTYIRYGIDEANDSVDLVGKVKSYAIPNNLYEISSIFLAHEHIHALKDTIYYEYIYNMTIGETIPLFYELISCGDNDNLRNEMIKIRLMFLLDNREEYCLFNDLLNNKEINSKFDGINFDIAESDMYNYLRTKVGSYLNSFYYAIILYNLYKDNPLVILNLVSSVLRKEMTTLDLLNDLGIYGDIRGSVFEKELGKIKKRIK